VLNSLATLSVNDVLLRFFLGGAAVAISAVIGRMAGGRIGGIFAAFPAVYLSAVISVTMGSGEHALGKAIDVSKGALIGMLANIICAICASIFIRRYGLGSGLIRAIAVWFGVSSAIFFSTLYFGLV
jgi:uncharacterized membrane protein (GlpM family)